MRSSWVLALGSGALVSMLLVQVGPAQQQGKQAKGKAATAKTVVPDGDWPLYSRDLTSARYSPLKQINASNVATLQQAWTYRPAAPAAPPAAAPAPAADGAADGAAAAGRGGGRGAGGGRGGGGRGGGGAGLSAEVTPIVIGGIMYLPGGNRVYALEADTGKEMWTYSAPGAVANRAVGYWPGDGQNPPRVIFTTGTKMMALNANTGAVDPGFGKEGSVEIEQNWGGAPYIFRNLIILGVNNGENNAGPPGDTRTYDDRRASVELQGDSAAGRTRPRDLARRRLEGARRRQCVGLVLHGGRRAQSHLHAFRFARGKLLGRRSQRRESV
jgi:outer membrane protein assembly factor BamB